MANFGVRLGYPVPEWVAARERERRAASGGGARPAAAVARVRRALRRAALAWLDAQARVAGSPWPVYGTQPPAAGGRRG